MVAVAVGFNALGGKDGSVEDGSGFQVSLSFHWYDLSYIISMVGPVIIISMVQVS